MKASRLVKYGALAIVLEFIFLVNVVQCHAVGNIHRHAGSSFSKHETSCEFGIGETDCSTAECNLDPSLIEEIAGYKDVAKSIIDSVLDGSFKGRAYADLEDFIDRFGPRFSGTETLERAIDFMLDRMKEISLENVHGENVTLPQWVRGYERADMITPRKKKLNILGLGYSVGTPMGGLEADVLVVKNFTELQAKAMEVRCLHEKCVCLS